MRALASFALPGAILAATAAVASSQNYPSTPSFTYHTGGETFGITFFGSEPRIGWVAEDGGRIRYTDPDGESWIHQAIVPASVRGQLRGIQFISDSVGYCVGDKGAVLTTDDGGVTWTLLATLEDITDQPATLHQVNFDQYGQTGWVMGDDEALYYTDNGGATWDFWEDIPGTHGADIYDIAFPNPEDRDVFVLALDYGYLAWTGNGGASWEDFWLGVCDEEVCPQPSGVTCDDNLEIWSVDFYDQYNGVAVGGVVTNNGYILRTSDGGHTWSQESCMQFVDCEVDCAPVPTFYGVVATGAESALTVGYASSVWNRTTDVDNEGVCDPCLTGTVGYGWNQTDTPNGVSNPPGNWIALADVDTAFSTARNGRIRKMTIGGTEIEDKGTKAWSRIEGGRFTDVNNGFLVGQERVIVRRTVNAPDLELVDGPHSGTPGQPNYLNAVDVSGQDVVAVGDGGNIRYSSNGGDTWADGDGQRSVAFNNVHFQSGTTVFAVGNNGVIDKSTDGGANWVPATSSPLGDDLHDIYFKSASEWLVVGANKYAAARSSVGVWTTVSVNGSGTPTLRALASNGTLTVAVGDEGSVYKLVTGQGFQIQSLGDVATTLQFTDVAIVPGTSDLIVVGDKGLVRYHDPEKILTWGEDVTDKWTAPKSYMGAKHVSVDMFSATSGMITGFQTGVLEVAVAHIEF